MASRAVRGSPGDAPARARLRGAAAHLSAEMEAHLSVEEQVLWPAVRALLAPEVQAQIVAELRARRRPVG